MERVLLDQIIFTDYGQFDLVWGDGVGFDGDADRFFAGQSNGLVGAADPNGIYINLARRSGGSPVRIVLLTEGPEPGLDEWEDIVEVSVVVPPAHSTIWASWAGETSGVLDLPPAAYRVRISARGRDAAAADEFSEVPLDAYLIEFWPSEPQPDRVVRTTSSEAAYWHRQWGARS